MQKELYRIENYIKQYPDAEIWIFARTQKEAKIYWEAIKRGVCTGSVKPYFVSSRENSIDGLNPENVIILVCGKWWESPVAKVFMDEYMSHAKTVWPIGEIPVPEAGWWYAV